MVKVKQEVPVACIRSNRSRPSLQSEAPSQSIPLTLPPPLTICGPTVKCEDPYERIHSSGQMGVWKPLAYTEHPLQVNMSRMNEFHDYLQQSNADGATSDQKDLEAIVASQIKKETGIFHGGGEVQSSEPISVNHPDNYTGVSHKLPRFKGGEVSNVCELSNALNDHFSSDNDQENYATSNAVVDEGDSSQTSTNPTMANSADMDEKFVRRREKIRRKYLKRKMQKSYQSLQPPSPKKLTSHQGSDQKLSSMEEIRRSITKSIQEHNMRKAQAKSSSRTKLEIERSHLTPSLVAEPSMHIEALRNMEALAIFQSVNLLAAHRGCIDCFHATLRNSNFSNMLPPHPTNCTIHPSQQNILSHMLAPRPPQCSIHPIPPPPPNHL